VAGFDTKGARQGRGPATPSVFTHALSRFSRAPSALLRYHLEGDVGYKVLLWAVSSEEL